MSFAIENVRITDCTWLLAGAGGPRFLAGLGAEDIRVEWKDRLDHLRTGSVAIPLGEEQEQVRRGEPLPKATRIGPNQGATFGENNPGKRGISLNLRTDEGKEVFKELVRVSDIVVECFTARTMERLGLDYAELRKVNPTIIYVQQPGFGRKGEYVDYVSTGPVAQAMSGLTEQSGLPSPYPPAGWGYSYMDWSGAYYNAMAMLSALYYRARTGEGQYIDCSQAESGIFLTGTAILDSVANGRSSSRTGNRSPYDISAPHGVYPCKGIDRWIAISVYNDDEWWALAGVLGDPGWFAEERFAKLSSRLMYQEEIDDRLAGETLRWEPFELMEKLQMAGVAAGVCQTAQDRIENDPQLQHLGFQVSLPNSLVGSWKVKDFPIHLSETPGHSGGTLNRGFPCYGEDNDYVYGGLLGMDKGERARLAEAEII
ncbi:CoA transferase [Dehalococcoidia bacterium]|nr:CoA transferase [Dehalococcoidia bacterium]